MKKIPLVKPQFDDQKLAKDFAKISRSGILTRGPYLAAFEKQLKDYLKIKYVFAVSSCTAALHLALVALDIKTGDEVLVSDFTFPASGNVVVQIGAKPVLVDINSDNFCINIDDLRRKITPKSKAVIIVHPFGYPAEMSEIVKIARKHHLLVIEDAACALGSRYQNKMLGALGDIGCFSFHPRKNITTGEGGAIITNDPQIAQRIEILRNHGGVKKAEQWEFIECGFNYRISELQAALGVRQMEDIDKIIHQRRKIAKKYLAGLKDIAGIVLPVEPQNGYLNFQSLVILLPRKVSRDQIIKKLRSKNIETVLGTYALHAQPSFARFGYKSNDLPNSYYAYQHSLTLPLYGQMTEKEIEYVVRNLKNFLPNPKS